MSFIRVAQDKWLMKLNWPETVLSCDITARILMQRLIIIEEISRTRRTEKLVRRDQEYWKTTCDWELKPKRICKAIEQRNILKSEKLSRRFLFLKLFQLQIKTNGVQEKQGKLNQISKIYNNFKDCKSREILEPFIVL